MKTSKKARKVFAAGLFFCFLFAPVLRADDRDAAAREAMRTMDSLQEKTFVSGFDATTRRQMKREGLEDEARQLLKKGKYDEAIARYETATDPSVLNYENEKSSALWGMLNAYQLKRDFDGALKILRWFLAREPEKEIYPEKRQELEALLNAGLNQSDRPVEDYIRHLRRTYPRDLPPHGRDPYLCGRLIYLYDYAGDAAGGLEFVETVLAGGKLKRKEKREYLKVKEAFQNEKSEKTRGQAIQVLVHSDYFPL
ncbi:MAG TPA: hypothetical protein PKL97_00445 [Candidatus Omnitrophota bacterium]|nr:hypothetical protein [Candidatus Omnitrophota bacterium]